MVRWLGGLVLLAAASASAAPLGLVADVDYGFIDQNGVGWAQVTGKVTVTLTFDGARGSLKIVGHRGWVDGVLGAPKTPGGPPEMKDRHWDGDVDESYAVDHVARKGDAIAFQVDAAGEHLQGRCAPTSVAGIARTTLYECTVTGFQWHTIASLPELHQPIVLDANARAKSRILDTLSGESRAGFGQRTVSEPKVTPAAPADPRRRAR